MKWSPRLLVSALLLASLACVGPATADSAGAWDEDRSLQSDHEHADDRIVERARVRLATDEPATVDATIEYEIPDDVAELEFALRPAAVEVRAVDGFERDGDRTFRWTGADGGGSVTIRYAVDEGYSLDERHSRPVGSGDGWAIAARPETRTDWGYHGDNPGIAYAFEVEGQGVAGSDLAFFGAYDRLDARVGGERIGLVVPEAASPATDPATILRSIEDAAARDLGGRSDEVLVIAAPSGGVDWQPPGLSVGTDVRVPADVAVDLPVNVWVHEYVHSRQNRSATTAETVWLVEGSADYYGALANLEAGATDFEAFARVLERGADGHEDVVLADPDTWRGTEADYEKGALVVAAIDREIRLATDGHATFDDVMRAWARAGAFDGESFAAAVEDVAGPDVREFAVRHTRTDATPDVWREAEHAAAFGDGPSATATPTQTATSTPSPDADSETPTATPSPDAEGPGLGVLVALAALAATGLLAARSGG